MKLLTVHSLAAHGTASLKVFLSVLGTRVLPVPSLYLTGLTNLSGIQKYPLELASTLEGSLQLVVQRREPVWLYVGYLGDAQQVTDILSLYRRFRPYIRGLLVDPVTGDQGRMYVPQSVAAAWPELLSEADWAFPNYTELKIFGNAAAGASADAHLLAFRQRFPHLNVIATSLPGENGSLAVELHHEGGANRYLHPRVAQHYGGTGDVFAAHFVKYYFFEGKEAALSMQQAAQQTLRLIRRAVEAKSPDLLLEDFA